MNKTELRKVPSAVGNDIGDLNDAQRTKYLKT